MTPNPVSNESQGGVLLALAARCEAATGPDRDIDRALCPVVGIRVVDEGHPLGVCYYDENRHGIPLPLFTHSMDAAIRLVPEGWLLANLSQTDAGFWWAELRKGYITSYSAVAMTSHYRAATAALALTAASLRARSLSGEVGHG